MNESNVGRMGMIPVDAHMQLVAPPLVMPAAMGDDVVPGLKQDVAAVMRGVCASVASNVCPPCDVACCCLPAELAAQCRCRRRCRRAHDAMWNSSLHVAGVLALLPAVLV